MATRHCITDPSSARKQLAVQHSDLLVAYLKVAVTANGRALTRADCPDVVELLHTAHENLLAAKDLVDTDRKFAA